MNADKIEKLVFSELFKLAGRSDVMSSILEGLNAEARASVAPLREEIEAMKALERELDGQIENILDAIAIDGDRSERTRRRRDKLEAELGLLQRKIERREREARS